MVVGGGVGKVISKQPTNRSAERGRRTGDPEKGAGREETHLPQERRKELSKPSEYSLPLDVHEQPLDHGNLICSNTLFLLSRFKWTQQAGRKRNQTEDFQLLPTKRPPLGRRQVTSPPVLSFLICKLGS